LEVEIIDCPKLGIKNAIIRALTTGDFDILFDKTVPLKFYASEHLVNCVRCRANRGYDEKKQTVVCGYDPDNEVVLQNRVTQVA